MNSCCAVRLSEHDHLGTAEERLQLRILDLVAAGRNGEESPGIPQDGRDVAP